MYQNWRESERRQPGEHSCGEGLARGNPILQEVVNANCPPGLLMEGWESFRCRRKLDPSASAWESGDISYMAGIREWEGGKKAQSFVNTSHIGIY